MTINAHAIIAASGIGKRMQLQGGISKQLLEIGDFPVIYHTLKAFECASTIQSVSIATRAENIETLQEMRLTYGFHKLGAVIEGGKERQDSIRNCIRAIEKDMAASGKEPDIIMVHDGARPFIRPSEIDAISALTMQYGACVPATKPKDTIKFIGNDPGFFGETPDRNRLLQVQTPQSFRSRLLIQAHEQAELEAWYGTDDASLVERFFPEQLIRVYETGYHNIKITTPEDIPVAEAIYGRLMENENNE